MAGGPYLTTQESNLNIISNPRSDPCNIPSKDSDQFTITASGSWDSINYPSGFPRAMSIGEPRGSPSYKPTKDPFQVTIINTFSAPSETPNRYISHVLNEYPNANWRKNLIQYSSGYLRGYITIITTYKISSMPILHPILDLYDLKQVIQESQVSLWGTLILFILNII